MNTIPLPTIDHLSIPRYLSPSGKIDWTQFPRQLDFADYEGATALVVDRCRQTPGVLALYKYGEVKFPGISDLDFLLIVEDQFVNDSLFDIPQYDDKTGFILSHEPLTVAHSNIASLPLLHAFFSLELVWGEDCQLALTPQTPESIIPLIVAQFLTKYPVDLICLQMNPELSVRLALAYLNSFHYFKTFFELAGIEVPDELVALIAQVNQLRANWLRQDEPPLFLLEQTWAEMWTVLEKCILALARHLESNFAGTEEVDEFAISRPLSRIKFVHEWNLNDCIVHARKTYQGWSETEVVLPLALGKFLLALIELDLPNLAHLRSALTGDTSIKYIASALDYAPYARALDEFIGLELARSGEVRSKYLTLCGLLP